MSQEATDILERLIRDAGYEPSIDTVDFKDKVLRAKIEHLERLTAAYRMRFPQEAVIFSSEALKVEAERNPHRVRAFLQAFNSPCTDEMLIMTWRILQGMKIREISMEYKEKEKFSLTVILAPPSSMDVGWHEYRGGRVGQEVLEKYQSPDVFDTILLRHLGVCKIDGDLPLLHSFNPLRVKG